VTPPDRADPTPERRRPAPSGGGSAAEVPIGQRLARLIRELQEPRGRRFRREGPDPVPRFHTDASEPPLVRLLPPERSLSAVARSRGAWEEAPGSPNGSSGPAPRRRPKRDARRAETGPRRAARARVPGGSGDPPVEGGLGSSEIRPRTDRPEIPEGSRLSAAEIQGLIRAGKGVRTVARIAEAPVDWVRYLAEPVMAERAAVVTQILQARPQRARAKGPGEPLGRALLLALRARKVAAPEHVLANGFAAYRRGHGPWRVRLTFRQDGRRLSALWAYDPRTNHVEPRNKLADELGWRRASKR
jgi:Protein of unknown function (DUF3071)